MSALVNANKMSSEEVLAKIASSGLKEYGVYTDSVTDRWNEILNLRKEENAKQELALIVALNNADTEGVLLQLLKEEPDKVFTGMRIVAYALDAKKIILQIPEYEEKLADQLQKKAEEAGVVLVVGLVNVRAVRYNVVSHLVTMAKIADLFDEEDQNYVYVSVNGGICKKQESEKKIADLLTEEGIDLSDVKALHTGYELKTGAVLELTLEEAEIKNGALRVLTSKDCIVKEVESALVASRKQSCGKCVFCREGLLQLHAMAHDITEGKGKTDTTEIMNEIGSAMVFSTPCSMGQESAKIALTSLALFGKEYEEHIKKKTCSAGVCFSKSVIYIDPQTCEGCEECADVCPANCIDGKKGFIHMIDEFDCTQCGKCMEACEYEAVVQTTGKLPKLPDRLTKCGKFKKR